MKGLIPCSIVLVLILSVVPQVRDNPKLPLHPNPGRVLNLVDVLKIKGEGEGYYFEGARHLEIDRAGNFYICDSWSSAQKSHLLKFSPEGRFVRDLYRQGEGPGEILSAYDFALSGPDVILFDLMKRKIVVLDTDGNFKAEFKKATSPFGELIGVLGDWIVFLRSERPTEITTSQLYEKKNVIVLVSKDGKTEKQLYTFANQQFFISLAQGGGSMNWDPFTVTIGADRMYVSRTQQYEIQVLDLKTAKIVSSFKRDYPRVQHVAQDWEKKFASRYNAPKRGYDNDISDLSFGGGLLWVRTSTESKQKGALYDLFDIRGRFVDSFYVNIRGRVLKIDGEFLYASTADENDLPLLIKYRIAERGDGAGAGSSTRAGRRPRPPGICARKWIDTPR